ncbi:conserved protein of unknown function [Streptomyces sp. KY75]|nr:hypothetical protein STIB_16680 [Streptomyces sp. IB2014 011-1]CAD5947297.1 conserved protein of unknown function [Streptomyces sp. KY75]CAD5986007.1 conserved protein of unknown function [Streptomyces sp. KY70]
MRWRYGVRGAVDNYEERPEMPHTAITLAAASSQQGPGATLRIVLLASIVGAALLAWFLLRGYGNNDDND